MAEVSPDQRRFFTEQLRETKKKMAVSGLILVAVGIYESCRIRDAGFSVFLLPVWLFLMPLMAISFAITLKNYFRGRRILVRAEQEVSGLWNFETINGEQKASEAVAQAEADLQIYGSTYKARAYYFASHTWYLPLSKQ